MTTILSPNIASIYPYSLEAIGLELLSTGIGATGTTSAVWITSNRAVFYPFTLTKQITVAQLFCYNGTAVSGNFDIGIYSQDGTRLMSSGSTAQSGTSVLQAVNITDTPVGPGMFQMGMSCDNTTATFFQAAMAITSLLSLCGVRDMASAFALPATATFATLTQNSLPVFGFTPKSVI